MTIDAARFESLYERRSARECWPWHGPRYSNGYGRYERRKRTTTASRASWLLYFGPIPDGVVVCHRCDNPICVNPAHLFLGTQIDNVHDMLRKGRGSGWKDSCPHGHSMADAYLNYSQSVRGKRMCRTCHLMRAKRKRIDRMVQNGAE